ncbi:integrase family protein [Halochromatium salexigens]|uniref:Integrase DNA-binding domain-containing protein n=1 Tax=Halochromatium salexigens TaxID=49447 RepID=A0AAJ0UGM9_HALSE|nr:hypothetical protein [Halochromatium salexigens]
MAVTKTSSRKWVLRYQLQGRRREMGLGSYPAVSLKPARDKAAQACSQAAAGIDPISARTQVQTATYVPHGFRSSFRDWAGEVSSFPREVCEMALAHVIENKAEAAYARGDLFTKRLKMMAEWAQWCGKGAADNPVDPHPQQQATDDSTKEGQ